jgi:multiple sugar transport system permease protein
MARTQRGSGADAEPSVSVPAASVVGHDAPGRPQDAVARGARATGWTLVLPLVAALGTVLAYPLVFSARISLQDYRLNALADVRFIGLDQYLSLPGNGAYLTAMRNTAVFVVTAVGLELVIGTSLALLVHRQQRLRNLTRALILTPMFVTPIAVGLMFRFLLNQQLGIVPALLRSFGVTFDFFGPRTALFSIALIDVWQWTPLIFLLVLAGLESLPKEPFEAARVDGASAWLTLRRVTLPLLRPVLVIAVVIRALDALRVFEYVYAITRGGPGSATETIQYHIWRVGFQFFRLGEAAAMSYTLVALVITVLLLALRGARRAGADGVGRG